MKKYLLVIILLLVWTGVDDLYAQKPTVTIIADKYEICGEQVVTITLTFDGSGTYIGDYEFDPGDGIPQGVNSKPFTLSSGVAAEEIPNTFFGNGYFKVKRMYDENLGESVEIIYEIDGAVIEDEQIDIAFFTKPTPVLSPDVKTCRKEITLTADPGGDNTQIIWDVNPPGSGTFVTEEATKATEAIFMANEVGSYDIIYKVINGACKDEFDSKNYQVDEVAEPSASYKLTDDRICSDETTWIEVTGEGANRYPLTLGFSDSKGNTYSQVLNTPNESISVSSDSPTVYTMNSLVDREGCESIESETLNLMVDTKPAPTAGVLDNSVCGVETQLFVQGLGNEENSIEWTFKSQDGSGLIFVNSNGEPDDAERNNPDARVMVNDDDQWGKEKYELYLTESVKGNETCMGQDIVMVEFYKEPVNVSLGSDATVYFSETLKFLTTGLDSMALDWNLPMGVTVDEDSLPKVIINNLSKGENHIECIVSNGTCSEVATDKLISVKGIYQTNGFSPNGDGVNDFFIIGGANNLTDNKLTIFDISGEVVFETEGFMVENNLEGWNGQRNDKYLPDGTYYYVFKGKHEGKDIDPIKSYLIIKGGNQ